MDLEKLEERCVASPRARNSQRATALTTARSRHRPERPIEWLANRLLEIRDRR